MTDCSSYSQGQDNEDIAEQTTERAYDLGMILGHRSSKSWSMSWHWCRASKPMKKKEWRAESLETESAAL